MKIQPTIGLLAIGLSIAALPTQSVNGNPTGKNPNRPLAAHGTIDGGKALVDSLYEVYNEEEKFVIETYARRDNPERFAEKKIAKSYGRLWKARRDASHVQLMGETAGGDLHRKLHMLLVEVGRFGTSYRSTPKGRVLVQRINANLKRGMPRLTKFLEQAERALEQGKLEIVETQMEAKGVELQEQYAFLSATDVQKYDPPFAAVMSKTDQLLTAKRKQDYMTRATEVMNEQVVAAVELPAEAARIRNEIASAGTAKLSGDKTGGPTEAFAYIAKLWGNASAGLTRATAIQWAFTHRTETNVQPSHQQLEDTAVQSLASIIEAAAASTPPEQVPTVYSELLKQISILDRRSGRYSSAVQKGCESALAKLAAKRTDFPAQVAAYKRATSEPLRWRKLYAIQQAKNLIQQFPNTTRALDSEAAPTAGIRPDFVRVGTRETKTCPPSFSEPASWMVQEAAARLTGKPVSADQMIRLSPTSSSAVIPYSGGCYGSVPVPMPSDAEVADLKTAIVVDDAHGPLTIDSADAVSASELHDYVTVSGVVEKVYLESPVSRFIGLPDAAYMMASLSEAPSLAHNTDPVLQTCWRLDLKPMWAHHPYFTVRVKQ